jgi:Helix-loop-helix DNA-binding domain
MGSGSFLMSGSGSNLVLDGERKELVRAPAVRIGKKSGGQGGLLDEKAMIALRNHSEAERRRRERINSHLAVLRGMISGTEKVLSLISLASLFSIIYQVHQFMCVRIRASVSRSVVARILMHINSSEPVVFRSLAFFFTL